jgi:ribonuclease P protein component
MLREAFRLHKHELKGRYDILFVARAPIRGLKFRQVEALALDLFRKGGLLREAECGPPGGEGLSGGE